MKRTKRERERDQPTHPPEFAVPDVDDSHTNVVDAALPPCLKAVVVAPAALLIAAAAAAADRKGMVSGMTTALQSEQQQQQHFSSCHIHSPSTTPKQKKQNKKIRDFKTSSSLLLLLLLLLPVPRSDFNRDFYSASSHTPTHHGIRYDLKLSRANLPHSFQSSLHSVLFSLQKELDGEGASPPPPPISSSSSFFFLLLQSVFWEVACCPTCF
jgi:hypothetical protein